MGEDSPKNKVKFLCSYGGKVLPRPSDGILKYIGGETRVICVPRDVTFSELMKKVSGSVDIGDVVLKYQLVPEDLDTLVAVRTQEDVKHMMEEYDGHGSMGSTMLRAFLFPKKPLIVPIEPYWLEQRYIDAINGIIRISPSPSPSPSPCPSPRGAYSACCSPKSNSPDAHTTTTADSPFHPSHSSNQNQNQNQNRTAHLTIPKVRSSPNLSNLTTTNNIQPLRAHHHHHHPLIHYPPSSTRQDPQIGGRVPPTPITIDRGFNYYYSTTTPQHKPSAYHEHSLAPYVTATNSNAGAHVIMERLHTVPRRRSPRNTIWE